MQLTARDLMPMAIAEALFIGAAVVAYLVTGDYMILIGGLLVGSAVGGALFFSMYQRRRQEANFEVETARLVLRCPACRGENDAGVRLCGACGKAL